jgi:hypothetical protein
MPQRTINIGAVGNDGTGDDLRTGATKINDNFTEVYSDLSSLQLAGTNQAPNAGISFVNSGIRFDGTTRDSNLTHTLLNVVDPTSANVATLPDSTGTIAFTSDIRPTIYNMVDSGYVQARQKTYLDSALAGIQFLDSAEATQIITNTLAAVPYSIIPLIDSTFDLGSSTHKWKDAYFSGNTIHLGGIQLVDNAGKLQIKDDSTGAIISNVLLDSAAVINLISPEYLSNVASGVTSYEFTIGGRLGTDSDWHITGGGFDSQEAGGPDLYLLRGLNYSFVNTSLTDTLYIKTTPSDGTGDQVTGGFRDGANGDASFIWNVPFDAPETLYYKSSSVGGPSGIIYIDDPETHLNATEVQTSINNTLAAVPYDLLPDTDSNRSLGSPTKKWKDLYLSGNTLHLGNLIMSVDSIGLQMNQAINAEIRMTGNLDVQDGIITSTTGDIQIIPKTVFPFGNNKTQFLHQAGDAGFLPNLTLHGTDVFFGDSPDFPDFGLNNIYMHVGRISGGGAMSGGYKASIVYHEDSAKFKFKDSDGWFSIDRDPFDSADAINLIDSAYVQARQDYAYSSLTGVPTTVSTFTNDANYLDSATVQNVIDATYIQANQTTYDFLDSAEVVALIDSAYVQARQTVSSAAVAYIHYGRDASVTDPVGVSLFSTNGSSPPNGPAMPVAGTATHITASFDIPSHGSGSLTIWLELYKNGSGTSQIVQREITVEGDYDMTGTISNAYAAGDNLELRLWVDTGSGGMTVQNISAILRIQES